MDSMINNPFLRPPLHPNYHRRSRQHDYCRPAKYLITIGKADSTPILSIIQGDVSSIADQDEINCPHAELTEAGQDVEIALKKWLAQYPQIQVESHIIMPDHIHLCLHVMTYLDTGLSRAVANFMGKVTSCRRERILSINQEIRLDEMQSFFSKGFNDKIAFNHEQWTRQLAYCADNPRRYLMKKLNPDIFYKRWLLTIGDSQFAAIGNIYLLKSPIMDVVRFSRKYAPGEFEAKVQQWRQDIRNGGVIISPYIHPKEKEIRDYALAEGGSIIRVCENGFSDRFAPQGAEFKYAGSNRLLLIAPVKYNSQKEDMSYAKAQLMNKVAELVASADWIGGKARIRPLK